MKSIIRVSCVDQTLQLTATPQIASGGREETRVEFSFCPLWEGLTRTAVFWQKETEPYSVLLGGDGGCTIPREVLTEAGLLRFGVFGVNEAGERRTSNVLAYNIVQGTLCEGAVPSDPTPEFWEQALAIVSAAQPTTNSLSEVDDLETADSLPLYDAGSSVHKRVTWSAVVAKIRALLFGSSKGVLSADGAGSISAVQTDSAPTADSPNLVTSGGVHAALSKKSNSNHNHDLAKLDGVTPITKGGTGADTVEGAAKALGRGQVLCSTAADVQAKAVTIEGYALPHNAQLAVVFTEGNSAEALTLQVNDYDPAPIYNAYTGAPVQPGDITAGQLCLFILDADLRWQLINPCPAEAPVASVNGKTGAVQLFTAGTADLVAGQSTLAPGELYFVYE